LKTVRNSAVRRLSVGSACLAVVLLGGCHRRQAPPTLPAILQAPDIPPPAPPPPAMESSLPEDIATAPSAKVTETRPRRPSRRTAPKSPASEASTPVDTASTAATPEGSTIGELSDGGDANPQTQQEAAELIASSEGRLNGLTPAVARQQQVQLRKVRYFLKQAKQALSSGDAEGAKTLATKAKLLLDDLAK
jgi:hypothetical protein